MNHSPPNILLLELGQFATDFYDTYLQQVMAEVKFTLTRQVVDFEKLNAQLPDNYDKLIPLLEQISAELDWSSFKLMLIPNITLFSTIDRLSLTAEQSRKIVHPVTAMLEQLQRLRINSITLAATRHTMQSHQLSTYFSHKGIEVKRPSSADIQTIDAIRMAAFEQGYSDSLHKALQHVLGSYPHVMLACTELSLLNRDELFLDMSRTQIRYAGKLAGGET